MITDNKSNGTIKGVYVIGEPNKDGNFICLATNAKPNWFRKFCTWLFIGWHWLPINEAKEKNLI